MIRLLAGLLAGTVKATQHVMEAENKANQAGKKARNGKMNPNGGHAARDRKGTMETGS